MNIFYFGSALLMLVAGAMAVAFLVLLVGGFLPRRREARRLRRSDAVGFVVSSLAFAAIGGCIHVVWRPVTDPAKAFEWVFHRPPPATVRDLRGAVVFGADGGAGFDLQFRTDEATFENLKPTFVVAVTNGGFGHRDLPEWWLPREQGQLREYGYANNPEDGKRPPSGFTAERWFVTRNPETGLSQFHWSGWD